MSFQRLLSKSLRLNDLKRRLLSTKSVASNKFLVERVTERALIKVSGCVVDDFLQGLMTNDINHLVGGSPSMYAMFLNSRGRILFDSIIYKTNEPKTYFIECDASAVDALMKHLLIYRLRKNVQVKSLVDEYSIWVACDDVKYDKSVSKTETNLTVKLLRDSLSECMICTDPRILNLGLRIITPKALDLVDSLKKIPNTDAESSNFYRSLRYRLGVGEGVRELPPETSFPLESNCDYLHGVSFHKGCYIGQELTARIQHTGVVRKRLLPITFSEVSDFGGTDIPVMVNGDDKPIGKLRASDGPVGIGLLRIEEALKAPELLIDGKASKTSRPFWWPIIAPRDSQKVG